MRNKRKIYLYTGVGFPLIGFITTYSLIKIGYTYKAIVYSNLIMSLTSLTVFYILNRKDFNLKLFDKIVAKELFKIGLPLLPTFLIYWIFNSMDRVMINRMLGPTELGIYSVGSKVASISQLIYTAFSGGFSYFKFSTMKDEDQVIMNSNLFEYLGLISFLIYLLISPFSGIIFKVLFDDKYFNSSIVFNYLFLSPLILMLFQIISSQLLVVKKSINITMTLLFGASINIILNFYLIPSKGIEGASFSTLASYIASLLFMMIICKKMGLIILQWKFNFSLFLVIILNILNILNYKNINYLYLISFLLIVGIYLKKIKEFMNAK